ncbi:translation initiation factor IF-2-like [Phoenix dactylifera]|uniref:Translation initiation factor IF-2-like n=1 Tax=Phoenix dactylifera TaxID=42345 RepID=A0A8B8Z8Y1_PHODC|nr:translation initiation factor IF-2-like [Phoenix dactylifera]
MKTIILSWLLLVLLLQSLWCSAMKMPIPEGSGPHQLPQLPQGQRLQGPNKTTELSEVRRGGECEDSGARRKENHKGEGGPAGGAPGGAAGGTPGGAAGDAAAGRNPGSANSDYSRSQHGHHSAALQMQVRYTSHLSAIPSIWLILVLLFFY